MAYSIVVGYDGSEHSVRALDAAIEWAKLRGDAEIMVACAQHRSAPGVGFRGLDFGVEEMWDKMQVRIEAELDEAAARVKAAGIAVATACTPDRADESIIKIARDTGAQLIVLGVKGAGSVEKQRTAVGSTTTRVLQEAGGIPVLVV